jgi:anti-sigma regulatory factor (Ser/Thr protein kinase)
VALHATRTFAAGPDGVAAADSFLDEFGHINGVAERVVFRARVCVAELAANVLEHGQAGPDTDSFTVTIGWDGSSMLDLEFTDTSRPFDPTRPEAVPADLGIETTGGRGLRLLQGLATRSQYRRDGKLNRVNLQFLASHGHLQQ